MKQLFAQCLRPGLALLNEVIVSLRCSPKNLGLSISDETRVQLFRITLMNLNNFFLERQKLSPSWRSPFDSRLTDNRSTILKNDPYPEERWFHFFIAAWAGSGSRVGIEFCYLIDLHYGFRSLSTQNKNFFLLTQVILPRIKTTFMLIRSIWNQYFLDQKLNCILSYRPLVVRLLKTDIRSS